MFRAFFRTPGPNHKWPVAHTKLAKHLKCAVEEAEMFAINIKATHRGRSEEKKRKKEDEMKRDLDLMVSDNNLVRKDEIFKKILIYYFVFLFLVRRVE